MRNKNNNFIETANLPVMFAHVAHLEASSPQYVQTEDWDRRARKSHMYPAVFESRPVLGQSQDEQAHVVLFPSSQTEAEAPLAALQLHHETALWFTDENMSFWDRKSPVCT